MSSEHEAVLDPVTFSVHTDGDPLAWHDHLEANDIPHSDEQVCNGLEYLVEPS